MQQPKQYIRKQGGLQMNLPLKLQTLDDGRFFISKSIVRQWKHRVLHEQTFCGKKRNTHKTIGKANPNIQCGWNLKQRRNHQRIRRDMNDRTRSCGKNTVHGIQLRRFRHIHWIRVVKETQPQSRLEEVCFVFPLLSR
jgi:hypothetical protein